MSFRRVMRNKSALVAIAIAAVTVLALGGVRACNAQRKADRHLQTALKHDLAQLARLPGAIEVGTQGGMNGGFVWVSASYRANASYDAIRKHYDAEAARSGWVPQCDVPVRDWGRDLGERHREYRRGDRWAAIEYVPARDGNVSSFTVAVSSHPSGFCRD